MNVLRIQGRLVSRMVAWTRQDLGKIYLILAGSPGESRVWKGQFRGSGCRPGCRWELCAEAAEGKGDQRHRRTNLATFPGFQMWAGGRMENFVPLLTAVGKWEDVTGLGRELRLTLHIELEVMTNIQVAKQAAGWGKSPRTAGCVCPLQAHTQ